MSRGGIYAGGCFIFVVYRGTLLCGTRVHIGGAPLYARVTCYKIHRITGFADKMAAKWPCSRPRRQIPYILGSGEITGK